MYKKLLPTLLLLLMSSLAQAFCFEEAAARYSTADIKIPPLLLMAIAQTESKMNPQARARNTNGTFDIGIMQINSVHLPKLSQFGISESTLQNDACTNVQIGAWVLSQCIANHGYNWRAVGCYNTGSRGADSIRQVYVQKVQTNLNALVQKYNVQVF